MSRLRRIALTVAAMLAVLLLTVSFRYVQSRGVFASVEDKAPGICRTVAGIGGVVDVATVPNGNAYLASADGVYLYDGGKVVRFAGTPKSFHPAALTMAERGELLVLFSSNGSWDISTFSIKLSEIVSQWDRGVRSADAVKAEKKPALETIAVTKPIPPTLEELGRLSADTLTDPAALAALPLGRFYLVNHHSTHTALGRWLDDVFLIPRAEVQFFDSMKFVTVAKRLNSPSSVALSADGTVLYVAQELPHTVASFKRNDFTGALGDVQLLNLPAAPTKITVAKDGSLIVAARPKRGQGAVYRVRVEGGVPQSAELLYANKSGEITAAAEVNGHLLIGSDKTLLACDRH